ncbi:hypothetical protein TYRP_008366 [Tyrophagus putrescentiae]|nr:hypothetical protein TYRP_008366 [Tyrophagus putrescentiae]
MRYPSLLLWQQQQHQLVAWACYFPIEWQGTFLIQTQASRTESGSRVSYSEVTVEADAIPPWGRCHRRRGHHVILKDITGAEDCMRCFHLSMKTPNVIQLHTEGIERCYTNEEAARATCPLDKDVFERRNDKKFKEIILYRKHVPGGLQSIEHVFCPFNGRFRFEYSANGGKQNCDLGFSEMSNCPHGNALNVKFRKCNFPTTDVHFMCLGDWESPRGDRYIALMDLREEPEARPKYRCGLYKENQYTGQYTVSLSSDSTCDAHLANSTEGFESLTLTPLASKRRPALAESAKCHFPQWTIGKWRASEVERTEFIYKDEHNQFRTTRSKCIMRQNDTPNERFIVHTATQCGEQTYSCLWMKRRSPNIMEFKFSDKSSTVMNEKLCDDRNFISNNWITEGKEKIVAQSTPCPIMGDYTGEVPGSSGLCAKVASDCNNPDIMFHSVSSCENRSHVYEEREYRCLGNWEEDGVLYTFTQRRDMPGYQCFAGKIYKNGDEAHIKEAGEHSCVRGEDPLVFGMKIIKQASCPRPHFIPSYISKPRPAPMPSYPIIGSSSGSNSGNVNHRPTAVSQQFSPPATMKPPMMPPMRFRPTLQPHYSFGDQDAGNSGNTGGGRLPNTVRDRDNGGGGSGGGHRHSEIDGFLPLNPQSPQTSLDSSARRCTAALSGVLFYLALTLTTVFLCR